MFFKKPDILTWIDKMFNHAKQHKWNVVYFAFDIHGVISQPDYRKTEKEIDYYSYSKETLQMLSKRDDIIMYLFTSSYPDEIKEYVKTFEKDQIKFKFINTNPDISEKTGCFGFYEQKPYFNVLFDDKAGFKPKDWKYIYKYFKKQKYRPDESWSFRSKEEYHKK